jgi:hypothetical protein
MNDLFASLFEWFGLNPFYSKDLGEHLRGWDITCTDYIGSPLYVYVGLTMVILTVVFYILQYHLINSSRFNKRMHWWIVVALISGLNFFVAFILAFNDLQFGNYCSQLRFTIFDCLFFGLSVAIWSWILFMLLTSLPYPRSWAGHNMTETTFWKPRL